MAVSIDAQAAINEIAAELEARSASEAEIKSTAELESKALWSGIREKASAAGMSIMDWMQEKAFGGSQNPQGLGQQALAAISHPFAKTAEVAFDYINPYSPGGYMHSEELPDALSFLNENQTLRTGLAKNPVIAAAPALLGGFAYPINEWAEGKDVTKGALTGGILSLAGPMAGLISRTAGAGVRKVAPNLADDTVDMARRNLNKAMVAGSALGVTGAGLAKTVGKLATKPIVKVAPAALAKVALVTERLYDKVAASLRISLNQTPLDINQAMKVDDLYPNRAAGGTNLTEDLGYQPGKVLSQTLDSVENKSTLSFFQEVIRNDAKLADLIDFSRHSDGTLRQTEIPDFLKDGFYGMHRRADVEKIDFHGLARYDQPGGAVEKIDFHDDIAEAIARNLDEIDDAKFGRSLQRMFAEAEKAGIDVANPVWKGKPPTLDELGLPPNVASASQAINPNLAKAKQVDRYLDYHGNAIGHVAHAQESMVYGSDLIEHLAKTDPEHLANVMRAVIRNAEEALATPANTINASGRMVRTDHAIEQFKLDTAKEILEALLGG
jgi:hypothetical protein